MPKEPDLEIIATAAQEGAEDVTGNTDERLSVLEEQMARLESVFEQQGHIAKISSVLQDYVSDLRDEQSFLKIARYVFGGATLAFVIILAGLLALAIFSPASPLLKAPVYAAVAFVVGITSGIVLLLLGLAKGVFRSASERHSDGFLPPQIEAALSLYDRLNGKN